MSKQCEYRTFHFIFLYIVNFFKIGTNEIWPDHKKKRQVMLFQAYKDFCLG